MEPVTIIGAVLAATGAGLGVGVGARLLPLGLRAGRDLRRLKQDPEDDGRRHAAEAEGRRRRLERPAGRRRDSSIVGFFEDALRHADGSYSCGYEAQLLPSMLAPDSVVEARYYELVRMLAAPKPLGTVIQFRFSSGPDPGRAIASHLRVVGGAATHREASLLHALNVDFYRAAAEASAYRHGVLSAWVRVPVRQAGDATSKGLSAFIPAVAGDIRKQGLAHLAESLRRSYRGTAEDGVVRRIVEDEREARVRAEKVFRLVERECPLALRRLGREELWEAVYLGHRQNARTAPVLLDAAGLDVRDYLCGESIDGDGWYVMHGSHPAGLVSMFVPPQPVITADALRRLTLHPGLTFRHTLVAEFIHLDQRKAVRRLDRRVRQIRRT